MTAFETIDLRRLDGVAGSQSTTDISPNKDTKTISLFGLGGVQVEVQRTDWALCFTGLAAAKVPPTKIAQVCGPPPD